MTPFATLRLPSTSVTVAPDGSSVRPLLRLASGSMAHFELAAALGVLIFLALMVFAVLYIRLLNRDARPARAGRV